VKVNFNKNKSSNNNACVEMKYVNFPFPHLLSSAPSGKTHLALAIGFKVVNEGYKVWYDKCRWMGVYSLPLHLSYQTSTLSLRDFLTALMATTYLLVYSFFGIISGGFLFIIFGLFLFDSYI